MNKILLDRSIFCQNKIILLQKSNLKELTRRGVIKIYGNPILFEETLNLWFKDRKDELNEHLEYILDITKGRWFRDRSEVWKTELEDNQRGDKYFFLTDVERQNKIKAIKTEIMGRGLDKSFEEQIKEEKKQNAIKRNNIKSILLKMQKDISEALGQQCKRRLDIKQSFEDFYNKEVDLQGEMIIKSQLIKTDCKRDALSKNWKRNKNRCPYFSLWIKAFLYLQFRAMSEPNKPIDKNAIPDIDQLVHMKDLDIIVSDEKKFMKDVFNQLYGNNKQFLSLDGFLGFINNYYVSLAGGLD